MFRSVREKIVGDDEDRQLFSIVETGHNQGSEKPPMRPTGDDLTRQQTSKGEVSQSLVLDYMGGLDVTAAVGLIIEGDEFFDAGSSLLEENEEDSLDQNDDYDHKVVAVVTNRSHSSPMEVPTGSDGTTNDLEETGDEDETPGAVVVDETPLHRMYLPGKIIHIYSHRAVYKAAYVSCDFRELRRISPAENMLTDHKCKPYYEALLELRTVRRAAEAPPRWVSFDCDDTCTAAVLCRSIFRANKSVKYTL